MACWCIITPYGLLVAGIIDYYRIILLASII